MHRFLKETHLTDHSKLNESDIRMNISSSTMHLIPQCQQGLFSLCLMLSSSRQNAVLYCAFNTFVRFNEFSVFCYCWHHVPAFINSVTSPNPDLLNTSDILWI